MVTSCAGGIVEKFELKRSSTAKEIVYCPLNAHANINSLEYHFMYEGFANAYGTTPRLVIKGCYETAWQKKNNHGCVSLTAPDDKTFKITTYYLDQDKNPYYPTKNSVKSGIGYDLGHVNLDVWTVEKRLDITACTKATSPPTCDSDSKLIVTLYLE